MKKLLSVASVRSDEEEIEAYKQALRIDPDNVQAHLAIGGSYAFLNDVDSALEEYKILKILDPEKANLLFNEIYK
jgi:tetratricopeptide (TPR) repeat protein|tara:strand:+ start:631 stop:855 length:225 start_codon:yes stop_codon:yes gene_type:complete